MAGTDAQRTNGTVSVAKLIGQKLARFVSKKSDQQLSMNPEEHNQKKKCDVCVLCVMVVWYVLVCGCCLYF